MEVENFVPENNKQDWFDELSSNQKQRIEQSLADLAGKFVRHDDVRRKVKLLLKISKSKRPHYSFSKCAYFFLNFETFGATTEEQYGFLSPFKLK